MILAHLLSLLSASILIVVKTFSSLAICIFWLKPPKLRRPATKVAFPSFLRNGNKPEGLKIQSTAIEAASNHGELKALDCTSTFHPYFEQWGKRYVQPLGAQKQKRARVAGIDQDELVDPSLLADPDSCFSEFKGVQIHHKICNPNTESESEPKTSRSTSNCFPRVLLHGFGASVFSWNQVMRPLSHVASSKVLAFDRPAFGLTSGMCVNPFNQSLNPYSTAFSALATSHFIYLLASEKAILVGHSAGSYVAVETYFQAPERVAAMILVAPAAILAPLTSHNLVKKNAHVDSPNSTIHQNQILWLFTVLSNFSTNVAHPITHLAKGMVDILNSACKKALSALMRSSMGVMLPLISKGWDEALVEFVAAMFTDSVPESTLPLPKRLRQISCPVLIITGNSDPITSCWNSKKLSRAIPGSCLQVIKNCGHIPHEEKAQEFVSIVDKFVQKVFGGL